LGRVINLGVTVSGTVNGGLFGSSQEQFYKDNYLRLFNLSYSILKSRAEAEEVMHDTLLKYFDSEIVFNTSRERESWLSKVCVNLSIDRFRKRERERGHLRSNLFDHMEGEQLEEELEQEGAVELLGYSAKRVRKAVECLPAGYRMIITLLYFEGYDYQEIAQITGIKEPTLRTQHARAKRMVAQILKKRKKERRWRV